MKKLAVVSLVIIIAAMSVIAVSAAPRGGYYDQIGNKYWCNSDSYGCWVTGENGGHEYIMFWSEAAAAAIMGPNSGAPVGTLPGTSTLNLAAPVAEAAAAAEKKDSDGGGEKPQPKTCDPACTGNFTCNTNTGKCECSLTCSAGDNQTCTANDNCDACVCTCNVVEQCDDGIWNPSTCQCDPTD